MFVATIDLGEGRYVVVSERMRGANDSSASPPQESTTKLDIIVLKDRVHHRAYWDSVAKVDIRTSVPGQGPSDLTLLHYENIPEDIYPVGKKAVK